MSESEVNSMRVAPGMYIGLSVACFGLLCSATTSDVRSLCWTLLVPAVSMAAVSLLQNPVADCVDAGCFIVQEGTKGPVIMSTQIFLIVVSVANQQVWLTFHAVCPGRLPAIALMGLAWIGSAAFVLGPTIITAFQDGNTGVTVWAVALCAIAIALVAGIACSPVLTVASSILEAGLPKATAQSNKERLSEKAYDQLQCFGISCSRRWLTVLLVRGLMITTVLLAACLLIAYDLIAGASSDLLLRFIIYEDIVATIYTLTSVLLVSSAISQLVQQVAKAKDEANRSRMQHVRQFIRYVFHEARVPLQAVSLGVEEIEDILRDIHREHRAAHRGSHGGRQPVSGSTGESMISSGSIPAGPLLSPNVSIGKNIRKASGGPTQVGRSPSAANQGGGGGALARMGNEVSATRPVRRALVPLAAGTEQVSLARGGNISSDTSGSDGTATHGTAASASFVLPVAHGSSDAAAARLGASGAAIPDQQTTGHRRSGAQREKQGQTRCLPKHSVAVAKSHLLDLTSACSAMWDGCTAMQSVFNDVLDAQRIQDGRLALVDRDLDLRQLLRSARRIFRPVAQTKGIALRVGLLRDPRLGEEHSSKELTCDSVRLSQVINNLISNAMKFTEQGGVTVMAKLTVQRAEHHTVHDGGGGDAHMTSLDLIQRRSSQSRAAKTRMASANSDGSAVRRAAQDVATASLPAGAGRPSPTRSVAKPSSGKNAGSEAGRNSARVAPKTHLLPSRSTSSMAHSLPRPSVRNRAKTANVPAVRVDVQPVAPAAPAAGILPEQVWLQVAVSDTGCGIDTKDQAKLFQPFQQTRQGLVFTGASSGLGLFISRGIVRQMGGDLSLESQPGKGSEFRLSVPIQLHDRSSPQSQQSFDSSSDTKDRAEGQDHATEGQNRAADQKRCDNGLPEDCGDDSIAMVYESLTEDKQENSKAAQVGPARRASVESSRSSWDKAWIGSRSGADESLGGRSGLSSINEDGSSHHHAIEGEEAAHIFRLKAGVSRGLDSPNSGSNSRDASSSGGTPGHAATEVWARSKGVVPPSAASKGSLGREKLANAKIAAKQRQPTGQESDPPEARTRKHRHVTKKRKKTGTSSATAGAVGAGASVAPASGAVRDSNSSGAALGAGSSDDVGAPAPKGATTAAKHDAPTPIMPSKTTSRSNVPCLVVEDVRVNRTLLCRALARKGFEPVGAEDGQQALDLAPAVFGPFEREGQGSSGEGPHELLGLVVMDRSMPIMGGIECTKRLRDMFGERLAIIGLTGDAMQEDLEEFRLAGLDGVMSKPAGAKQIKKMWDRLSSGVAAQRRPV